MDLSLSNFVVVQTSMTDNRKITLLVDTGADISLFKNFKISPKQFINEYNISNIKGITDGSTSSLGTTNTQIFINNYAINHSFHIVEQNFPIPADGILGRDFISKYQCQLDYANWTLTLQIFNEKTTLPIFSSPEEESLVIPPRCEVIRYIKKFTQLKTDSVILNTEIADGVFIAGSIVSKSNPIVRILNTTFESVTIKNADIQFSNLNNFYVYSINPELNNRESNLLQQLNKNIPDFAKNDTFNLCKEFSDIFCLPSDKLTKNNFYEQKLKLLDSAPVYIKNYRTPYSQTNEINCQVNKLLENEIIEPSTAEYNSPILLVPKKSTDDQNKWRLVIDYRQVNKKLIADKFPLPRIDDILDQLGRAKYFSTLDLKAGFHQISLEKNSRDITTFSTNNGSYRFTRLPFGLKVSPNSFQRMMSIAFAGITPEKAFLYMDDLIVIGCSKNHHLQNLRKVFYTCRKYNLKLNPEKCNFFQKEVTFLGHKITSHGILPDDSKFEIINKFPTPTNADAVKRFVAFCNYYRRFIPNFANICKPLNKLTRKNIIFVWSQDCQNSFEKLKTALVQPQILQYPDFNKQFIVTTDASKDACGAVLSQDFNGKDLPIAFASKSFTKGESNKATIEQELLAIHWAINYFRPYLYGVKFLVKSDHKPLVYLFSMKNPSSKLTRMRLDLEEYDFEVEYIKGKNNVGADALSRITTSDLKEISNQSAKILAVTRSMTKKQENKNSDTYDSSQNKILILPKIYETLDNSSILNLPLVSFEIKSLYLRIIMRLKGRFSAESNIPIINGNFSLEEVLPKLESMANDHNIKSLKLKLNDQIFQMCTINELKEIGQEKLKKVNILLFKEPQVIKNRDEKLALIQKYHDDPLIGGHCGQKKLLKKLRVNYRWKGMSKEVAVYIKNCYKCQLNKSRVKNQEPMVITPTPQKAFDITSIDTVGPFMKTSKNNVYAVTIQCELTKYIVIIPIPNKEAATVARAIMDHFILIYGSMKEIRTDLGTEYKNEIFANLTKMLNISQKFSTPYHSQTIGGCERNHRVLNEYLRMYINDAKSDWDDWVQYYSFCYNTTPSIYHDFSPFELVFGRKAMISETLSGDTVDPVYDLDAYYHEVKYRMQLANKRANEFIFKAKQNRKVIYDKLSNKTNFKPGDLVMLSNENRTKFDPWYKGPYSIISIEGVNCVIKDCAETNGKQMNVHKNRVRSLQ